ncbi:nucleotidyltransferase domain-containing protein [Candidatus Micrarchaeota archaeon]|nr:nucleotidyltransferase domain-containing protein [Candidatus Micrarchaeota archaeon]
MRNKDMIKINKFLDEFVEEISRKHGENIDFVLLFGSVARGEFRCGISDIDMIIQLKTDDKNERIEKSIEETFWQLDEKYGTELHQVCSTKRKDMFAIFEKEVRLYKPFEIIGPKDIDWAGGRINSPKLGSFVAVAPIEQFAKKIKHEGKIIYGRNILEDINVKDSFIGKIKSAIVPILLSIGALAITPISPDQGLKYSIKAVLYGIDNQIALIESKYEKTAELNLKILRTEMGEQYSTRLTVEAITAKKDYEKTRTSWSYVDKVAFSAQAPIYIIYNTLVGIWTKGLNRFNN